MRGYFSIMQSKATCAIDKLEDLDALMWVSLCGLKWMQWSGLPSSSFGEHVRPNDTCTWLISFGVTNWDCILIIPNISFFNYCSTQNWGNIYNHIYIYVNWNSILWKHHVTLWIWSWRSYEICQTGIHTRSKGMFTWKALGHGPWKPLIFIGWECHGPSP